LSDPLTAAEDRLIESLAGSPRGSRRNGTYALWLFVRTCSGLLPPDPLSEVNQRRRVRGLARRLQALALPSPLRRALAGGLRELAEGNAPAAAMALRQLVAPARESVAPEVGETLASAARTMRDVYRGAEAVNGRKT
jgi:hypothetical protein